MTRLSFRHDMLAKEVGRKAMILLTDGETRQQAEN